MSTSSLLPKVAAPEVGRRAKVTVSNVAEPEVASSEVASSEVAESEVATPDQVANFSLRSFTGKKAHDRGIGWTPYTVENIPYLHCPGTV